MELLPWIKPQKDRLCSIQLNLNPNALDYILENRIFICAHIICLNTSPEVIDYIRENPELIRLTSLISNKNAGRLIEEHIDEISSFNISMLYQNPNTLHLLSLFLPKKIDWAYLSSNTNPNAIQLLRENIDKIDWKLLSENESAIDILTEHQDKIVWSKLARNSNAYELILLNMDKFDIFDLCYNTNPKIIKLIEERLDTLDLWGPLSANPAAIKILEKNQDKIEWYWFSQNPAIFEFNYKKVATQRMSILREELMMNVLHPKRIERWLEQGLDIDDL